MLLVEEGRDLLKSLQRWPEKQMAPAEVALLGRAKQERKWGYISNLLKFQ